ncbi:hypothetical protein OG455_00895 [Kitasatospora sp. NBC_01287]|uniref:hypothetical protein n=1 Tax=Kitasatospora sp. NBC_01287 TaxID=2903573 RepID=UPI0022511BDC|nr:hypothetical protein [Kitasatospora sp. NBC_01287]MCX4744082.1 hypothetical protein [Kitasatospora sp. NBC_01287]
MTTGRPQRRGTAPPFRALDDAAPDDLFPDRTPAAGQATEADGLSGGPDDLFWNRLSRPPSKSGPPEEAPAGER